MYNVKAASGVVDCCVHRAAPMLVTVCPRRRMKCQVIGPLEGMCFIHSTFSLLGCCQVAWFGIGSEESTNAIAASKQLAWMAVVRLHRVITHCLRVIFVVV
jgi:hypothetical protein